MGRYRPIIGTKKGRGKNQSLVHSLFFDRYHRLAKRKNIPTAEYQSVMRKEDQTPAEVSFTHGASGRDEEKRDRNRDLDPQLVWRGKDQQDWSQPEFDACRAAAVP